MKKVLALILVLVLMLALAACGGKAEQGAKPESGAQSGTSEPSDDKPEAGDGVAGSKLYKFCEKNMGSGAFTMVYEIPGTEGLTTFAVDGGNFYINGVAEGYEFAMINNADGIFLLMPSDKMYMQIPTDDDAPMEIPTDMFQDVTEDAEYTTGKMDVEGKSYDYEEMVYEGEATRYCFDGNDLVYIVSDPGGENESSIKLVEIKDGADKSLFAIPGDYTSIMDAA